MDDGSVHPEWRVEWLMTDESLFQPRCWTVCGRLGRAGRQGLIALCDPQYSDNGAGTAVGV